MPLAHPTFQSFLRTCPLGLALLMAACTANQDAIFALDPSAQIGGGALGGGAATGGTGTAGGAGQAGNS
ncbi:MAG TPA: hypothetical protein VHZ95_02270, partial [Polyangiales bacterium]|nr:hypothetical protein [Polyangiales bacterium]